MACSDMPLSTSRCIDWPNTVAVLTPRVPWLVINVTALAISTASPLPAAVMGTGYSQTLSATVTLSATDITGTGTATATLSNTNTAYGTVTSTGLGTSTWTTTSTYTGTGSQTLTQTVTNTNTLTNTAHTTQVALGSSPTIISDGTLLTKNAKTCSGTNTFSATDGQVTDCSSTSYLTPNSINGTYNYCAYSGGQAYSCALQNYGVFPSNASGKLTNDGYGNLSWSSASGITGSGTAGKGKTLEKVGIVGI